jgi:hypothetical protein
MKRVFLSTIPEIIKSNKTQLIGGGLGLFQYNYIVIVIILSYLILDYFQCIPVRYSLINVATNRSNTQINSNGVKNRSF